MADGVSVPTAVVANEQSRVAVNEAAVARLAGVILEALGVHGNVELSVVFVDESTSASLNGRYRGREGPTDVLSFAIDDPSGGDASARPLDALGVPALLGDVVICPAIAAQNAPGHAGDRGHDGSVGDELALLLIHGILHIRGWDHEQEEEAERMEALEGELLVRYHELKAQGIEVAAAR
jgi:probable rRNA maturation factor